MANVNFVEGKKEKRKKKERERKDGWQQTIMNQSIYTCRSMWKRMTRCIEHQNFFLFCETPISKQTK